MNLTNKTPTEANNRSGHLYNMKFLRFNSTLLQRPVYCLTSVIEALKSFQDFNPSIRSAAIALYARELGICELHFYAIALQADKEAA